jgi:hypothetical protein
MPKFIPKPVEFAVASGGGVATSMLGEFLAHHHVVNAPSDEDGFKHMPIPPVSWNPNFRWIFVFGCPVAASISLFRRGYHALQSRKLQRGYRPYDPIPLAMSLREYAHEGVDRFHFERQFLNYAEHYLIHPTLFLRYDAIWDNLETVRLFLGLAEEETADFPPRTARQSAEFEVEPETLDQLGRMYAPFLDRLHRLPDCFVRERTPPVGLVGLLCTKNFHAAVRNGIVSRFRPVTGPYGE